MSTPYKQEPAHVASPSPHCPCRCLFISISSTIVPPCTVVDDIAIVHHVTTATARLLSSLIIPPSSTALSPIALQHLHVHPWAATATAMAFIATPLTVIALPTAAAATAATVTHHSKSTIPSPSRNCSATDALAHSEQHVRRHDCTGRAPRSQCGHLQPTRETMTQHHLARSTRTLHCSHQQTTIHSFLVHHAAPLTSANDSIPPPRDTQPQTQYDS